LDFLLDRNGFLIRRFLVEITGQGEIVRIASRMPHTIIRNNEEGQQIWNDSIHNGLDVGRKPSVNESAHNDEFRATGQLRGTIRRAIFDHAPSRRLDPTSKASDAVRDGRGGGQNLDILRNAVENACGGKSVQIVYQQFPFSHKIRLAPAPPILPANDCHGDRSSDAAGAPDEQYLIIYANNYTINA
jgi:hypothetical protein